MHNLAIDLKDLGHDVTGSDDEIYEPSKSRLNQNELLPEKMGWEASRISDSIDMVILGKHATTDNPELIKAQELGISIVSFPEFIASKTSATQRICISGSHGKTSMTAMIMHVLKDQKIEFDYLVGANLKGFDKMVKISGADILVVEGDEYPSSCLDDRAKMLHYNPTLAVITGIAWDHVNIYKTYESYIEIFRIFLKNLQEESHCFFDQNDNELLSLMINDDFECTRQSYLPFETNKKGDVLRKDSVFPVRIFGTHNLSNLKAAYLVCKKLGISQDGFFEAIKSFTGAAKRLELIFTSNILKVYKDFAHAPSKCKATSEAVRQKYSSKKIKGVLELHTFSSLDRKFIREYKDAMDALDEAIVFFDPEALRRKQMPKLNKKEIHSSFNHQSLTVVDDLAELEEKLSSSRTDGTEILLIMSSGNLGGISVESIFEDA